MGKVSLIRPKYFITVIAGIIIGVVIGATIIISLVSYRVDRYYEEIQKLKIKIEERDQRLKKLEKSINNQKLILKDIDIILIHELDEIDKITIEKYVEDKYIKLLGREVESIDIDLIEEVIDKRIFKVSNKEYQLKVTRIILTETLKMWIEIKLID